ncbi:DUF3099 domain-containing protein [Streptomyces beihaiensis]|uniref:DUF3099 domain-containing protein n=1 Tax=Streptomyces beihaiensis TaxID=2984495 RepID=A0ABT3TWG4_9ACTN|nr:DUF3099 domain-containing protein [Streptomyces beihaiensis]MCX3061389.1 DUF3099 domain-containing protein [Streptomyces beihaiensis]
MSRALRRRGTPPAESITRARTGLSHDVRGRQRRYLMAMLVRTACVVLMAATWNHWPVVAGCALAGAVVIPYVAVVVAQAHWGRQRGVRHAVRVVRPEPAPARVVLEGTLILPPERDKAA